MHHHSVSVLQDPLCMNISHILCYGPCCDLADYLAAISHKNPPDVILPHYPCCFLKAFFWPDSYEGVACYVQGLDIHWVPVFRNNFPKHISFSDYPNSLSPVLQEHRTSAFPVHHSNNRRHRDIIRHPHDIMHDVFYSHRTTSAYYNGLIVYNGW